MTIGRVYAESDPMISLRKDLGKVSVREDSRGVSIWTEHPNTLLELVRAAYGRQHPLSVDLLPQSGNDLHRVSKIGKKLQGFVHQPHLVPYYPKEGQRLRVFNGQRPVRRGDPQAINFFDAILTTADALRV